MQKGWTHEGFFLWERTVVLEGEGPSRATSEVPGPRTTPTVHHNRTTEIPPHLLSTVKNYAIINYRNVEQGTFVLCKLRICVHLCRRSRTKVSTSIFLPFLLFSILPLSLSLWFSQGVSAGRRVALECLSLLTLVPGGTLVEVSVHPPTIPWGYQLTQLAWDTPPSRSSQHQHNIPSPRHSSINAHKSWSSTDS